MAPDWPTRAPRRKRGARRGVPRAPPESRMVVQGVSSGPVSPEFPVKWGKTGNLRSLLAGTRRSRANSAYISGYRCRMSPVGDKAVVASNTPELRLLEGADISGFRLGLPRRFCGIELVGWGIAARADPAMIVDLPPSRIFSASG